MITVCFYGGLGKYGRKFKLDVATAGEAVRALLFQLPGLRGQLNSGFYRLRISGSDTSEDKLPRDMVSILNEGSIIHIVPVVGGAKSGGLFPIIAGIAIIAVAWWNPVGWLGASAIQGMYIAGGAMIASGMAMMLTKMPTSIVGQGAEVNNNTSFSNFDNAVTQGQPIPLCYGEMMVGSKVLSQGVSTE